jgi:hypothetical protein
VKNRVVKNKTAPPYSLHQIFRIPSGLALLSIVGLIAALVGDGWLDVLSWFALGFPLCVIVRHLKIARNRAPGI